MTAVVSRERAKSTGLTAAAGVLMLAVAVVMMVVAAPVHGHARAHGPARAHAAQLTTDLCHQLTSRSDSAAARACLARPSADSAWAEAYVPSMTSDSWSVTSSGRAARPLLASAAVS